MNNTSFIFDYLHTFGNEFRVGPYVAYFTDNFGFVTISNNLRIHDNYTVNFA